MVSIHAPKVGDKLFRAEYVSYGPSPGWRYTEHTVLSVGRRWTTTACKLHGIQFASRYDKNTGRREGSRGIMVASPEEHVQTRHLDRLWGEIRARTPFHRPPNCDEEALRQLCRILDLPDPETFLK